MEIIEILGRVSPPPIIFPTQGKGQGSAECYINAVFQYLFNEFF